MLFNLSHKKISAGERRFQYCNIARYIQIPKFVYKLDTALLAVFNQGLHLQVELIGSLLHGLMKVDLKEVVRICSQDQTVQKDIG